MIISMVLPLSTSIVILCLTACRISAQASKSSAVMELSATWQILGPFQIGTREAVWGADPLEAYGGFRELSYDNGSEFPSSLASGGLVKWAEVEAEEHEHKGDGSSSRVVISVKFPEIDWAFLRSIYGWSVLQYQAWARGNLTVIGSAPRSVTLYTDNVLELWIDGDHYFGGDFYAYRRAPLVLHFEQGIHQVDVRLIRDVRAMGGEEIPHIRATLEAKASSGGLIIDNAKLLISDEVSGILPSQLASVPVRNEGAECIIITDIASAEDFTNVSLLRDGPFNLAPGFSRPFPFRVVLTKPGQTVLSFKLSFVVGNNTDQTLTSTFSCELRQQSLRDSHKFTFSHPSGIVSYAILRPPSKVSISKSAQESFPVLVNLHGAGLEADSEQIRHMLDAAPEICAWLLFPSGVTSWSGDDWHNWGFNDVQAAIDFLPQWANTMNWSGPGVSLSDWLVSGHSNGGQGTWYMLSHYPDKVIAAAPVSGYTSIQAYVPYNMWQEAHPLATSICEEALSSYKHETLIENFVGVPLLLQHGSADDNVPAFHSRRMFQLLREAKARQSPSLPRLKSHDLIRDDQDCRRGGSEEGPTLNVDDTFQRTQELDTEGVAQRGLQICNPFPSEEVGKVCDESGRQTPNFAWPVDYAELPGKGHWFDGVMTTPWLNDFYMEHLNRGSNSSKLPLSFSIRVPGSGAVSSRGGIVVDQVQSPDQQGEIDVHRDDKDAIWYITTANIKRFHVIVQRERRLVPSGIIIDDQPEVFPLNGEPDGAQQWFFRSGDSWKLTDDGSWQGLSQRYGRQRGALGSILLTRDRFTIVSCGNGTYHVAAQIARNLFQYYGADSVVLTKQGRKSLLPQGESGNMITVAMGADLPPSELSDYPIRVEADGLWIRQGNAAARRYSLEAGLGAAFLRPLKHERLELVVWGADGTGLRQAARLVPTLTGSGQPDFVLMSRRCMWKGLGGVYAVGFLDSSWNVSQGSLVR